MLRSILAGASAALVLSLTAAWAGPVGPSSAVQPAVEDSMVTKVQGYGCFRGRDGNFYRRTRDGDIVQCGERRRDYYQGPPVYRTPRYDPRAETCAAVYNQCYAQYGRGSQPYVSCMRRQGC